MPRKPRCYVAGLPCHVIVRGNNRNACFFEENDYEFYLDCLSDACFRYKVALHAYVLMTNHVHLLLSPETVDGISRVMQSIGRRYVQYINFKYRRTGTLWEGRHKASLIEEEAYLLACYRYIELNPVRANMVEHPEHYPWTSYAENTGAKAQTMTTRHIIYETLGKDAKRREEVYRELVGLQLKPDLLKQIKQASETSMPLGSRDFRCQVERRVGRSLGHSKRGRPISKRE